MFIMILSTYKIWRMCMMKKILFIFAMLIGFTALPGCAKTAPVQSLEDFSFKNPPQTLNIKVLSNVQLNSDVVLFEGYVVTGKVMDVKGNTFTFIPLEYRNFHNDVSIIDGTSYANFMGLVDTKNAIPKDGIITKDSKFLLDFLEIEKPQEPVMENVVTPEGGIAPQVNKTQPILIDDTIPKTTKEFPGVKLESFDNGSHFNLEEPVIESEKKNSNINRLKQ